MPAPDDNRHLSLLSRNQVHRYGFVYEVQMHNGRAAPVAVHGREWGFRKPI